MADTGLNADGFATALMAAGEDGPDLARRLLRALCLSRDAGLVQVTTGNFAIRLHEAAHGSPDRHYSRCLSAAGLALGLIAGRGPLRRGCDGLACVGGKRCDACPGRKEDVQ